MYTAEVFAAHAQLGERFGAYDVGGLLTACTMHIMPMVNPDGVTLSQGGLSAVQDPEKVAAMAMVRPTYAEWKANLNGVDLNRQYPAQWEKKYVMVSVPASELFNGTASATEPEVQSVMRVCRNNVFKAALTFHTKGEVIYWADAKTNAKIPHAGGVCRAVVRCVRVCADAGIARPPAFMQPGLRTGSGRNSCIRGF